MPAASRTAIVTGGTAGIGLACARALHRAGCDVVVFARRADRLAALAAEGIAGERCDVAAADAVAAAVAAVGRRTGRIDVLVNSAGITRGGRFADLAVADLEALLAVNLLGTLLVTRAALPWLERSRGCIVNMSSALANLPVPGSALYVASKGGIDAFTRALSLEVAGSGVRVNAVQPGLVRSEIWTAAGMDEAAYATMLADRAKGYPLGRIGEPEEIADLVAWLCSEKAGWMTGALLPLDGGSSVGRR